MEPWVDILIPTYNREAALAVTLTGLISQTYSAFRVIISDQGAPIDGQLRATPIRVLEAHGHEVSVHRRPACLGIAEQRHFLLSQSEAPYVLFLDDDILLEATVLERLVKAIQEEGCGFVGSAPIGLSFRDDRRPHEQEIEVWEGAVTPEVVDPASPAWARHKLHNAANIYHVQNEKFFGRSCKYRLAWVGGCVLFDRVKLMACGGYAFWEDLPSEHAGEDVLAQLKVMARFGGCGLLPSGAYHLELPTTIPNRRVNAVEACGWGRSLPCAG